MADPTRTIKGMQGTYNPSTNTYAVSSYLTMTGFTGNITGNVTGIYSNGTNFYTRAYIG